MYIINIEMKVRFDPGKALVVKQKHDIDMESVRQEILAGRFVTRMVNKQIEHKGQKMFFVVVEEYVHVVALI